MKHGLLSELFTTFPKHTGLHHNPSIKKNTQTVYRISPVVKNEQYGYAKFDFTNRSREMLVHVTTIKRNTFSNTKQLSDLRIKTQEN